MLSRIHAMLHHAMKDAVSAHLIAKNPKEGTVVPKPNYRPKQILNEEQLDTFLEAVEQDEVWRDFFYTELTTGLCRGEICGLQWEDFDEADGTSKSSGRSVPAKLVRWRSERLKPTRAGAPSPCRTARPSV